MCRIKKNSKEYKWKKTNQSEKGKKKLLILILDRRYNFFHKILPFKIGDKSGKS